MIIDLHRVLLKNFVQNFSTYTRVCTVCRRSDPMTLLICKFADKKAAYNEVVVVSILWHNFLQFEMVDSKFSKTYFRCSNWQFINSFLIFYQEYFDILSFHLWCSSLFPDTFLKIILSTKFGFVLFYLVNVKMFFLTCKDWFCHAKADSFHLIFFSFRKSK